MNRLWSTLVILTFFAAYAVAQVVVIPNQEPGPRLIDGSVINQIITRVNGGPTCVTTTPTTATDSPFFVATRGYRVVAASEVHGTAAGGTSVIQVVKDTGTAAPGTGTDLLTNNTNGGFDLNATANTVQVGTFTATDASLTLAAGDRLSYDFANAIQSSAQIAITVCLNPL